MARAIALLTFIAVGIASTGARAQNACPRCTIVGEAPDALPGVADVPIAALRPGLSGAITGTFGWAYSSNEPWAPSERHRLFGGIAGSIHPVEWLGIGIRMQGRWESVARGGQPSDNGLVGYPTITARLSMEPVENFGLGLDAAVWMYGGEAPSLEPSSTSARIRAMANYTIRGDAASVTIAASVGGIIDNSRAAAPLSVTDRLTEEDRLSLGVSDYSGVLAGLGVAARLDAIEILGEANWRIHVGNGAPGAGGWPLHIVLGARYRPIGEVLELGAYADIRVFDARPEYVAAAVNVVPVDPLFGLSLQATVRLGVDNTPAVEPVVEPPIVEPPVETPTTGRVAGRVVDDAGAPVASATVELTPAGEGATMVSTTSDADGRWSFEDVPAGAARVVIRREGADPVERTIEVAAGGDVDVPVALTASIPQGEVRGVVQSFDGQALAGARIRIMPLGTELTTDADGAFEAEVPPGTYDVMIEADGHRSQTRHVEVQEHGVVVLNAQLQRGR